MPHSAEKLPEPKPQPQETAPEAAPTPSRYDLTRVAETLGLHGDYLASFTSFLQSDSFSLENALNMLDISLDEANAKIQEITKKQAETLQANVERVRGFGGKVIDAAATLNPLRYITRK